MPAETIRQQVRKTETKSSVVQKNNTASKQIQTNENIIVPVPISPAREKTSSVFSGVAEFVGTVIYDTGEAAIGASIKKVNSEDGTITDMNGSFTLTSSFPVQFEVSYIGYKKKNITINSPSEFIRIVLEEE